MREKALALLKQWNENDALVKNGLQVEAIMRHYAQEAGQENAPEGVDYWGCVGLLHDVDYEKYPEEHCKKAVEILQEAGYDQAFIHAVVSHGYGLCSDAEPQLYMEKVLYTIDELSGLINATAIMRPSRSVMDLEVKSVKKKFKDKKFAAGCSRDVIANGAQLLGWELDKLLDMTLKAMQAEEGAIEEAVAAL